LLLQAMLCITHCCSLQLLLLLLLLFLLRFCFR
jgi:hypothetical protein